MKEQVGFWEQASYIRKLVNAVREAGLRRHGQIESGGPLDKWLQVVAFGKTAFAESLSP